MIHIIDTKRNKEWTVIDTPESRSIINKIDRINDSSVCYTWSSQHIMDALMVEYISMHEVSTPHG